MKRQKRKGFTIVELVIVIGVIGILTAILIPTFVNLTNRAQEASNQSYIKDLNTQMAIRENQTEEGGGKNNTMYDAVIDADAIGFSVEKLYPVYNRDIVWNSESNRFSLLNEDGSVYAGETDKELKSLGTKVWKIASDKSVFDKDSDGKFVNNRFGFSIYAREGWVSRSGEDGGVLNGLTVGFDAGKNVGFTNISYVREATSEQQNVVIRTNSYLTTLSVDAPNDTVHHYDKAGIVNVISAHAAASYHENGTVPFLDIAGGHVVLESEADVSAVYFTANAEGEFKNNYEQTISLDLSSVPEEKIPTFHRDTVAIADQGTYVCEVKQEQTEYIWLWGEGTQSEMVVSTSAESIAVDDGAGGYVLADNVVAGTEEGTIADQIANNELGQTKTTKQEAMTVLDEGYTEELAEVEKDDGTQKYVARIGITGYETFLGALDAAIDGFGNRIIILQDCDYVLPSRKDILDVSLTIDLNGHTVTNASSKSSYILRPNTNCTLTLTDSDDAGTGSFNTNLSGNVLSLQNNAIVNINSLHMSSSSTVIMGSGTGQLNIQNSVISTSSQYSQAISVSGERTLDVHDSEFTGGMQISSTGAVTIDKTTIYSIGSLSLILGSGTNAQDIIISNLNIYAVQGKGVAKGISTNSNGGARNVYITNTIIDLNGTTQSSPKGFDVTSSDFTFHISNTEIKNVKIGIDTGDSSDFILSNTTINASEMCIGLYYGATATIESGTYTARGSQVVYVYDGNAAINGGTFTGGGSTSVSEDIYRYTLNCYDSNYSNGSAQIHVSGGMFYSFDPTNNAAEGQNTSFAESGYTSTYDTNTGYYSVVPSGE